MRGIRKNKKKKESLFRTVIDQHIDDEKEKRESSCLSKRLRAIAASIIRAI